MTFFTRHPNIYAYIPNLIGYIRVATALYSFAVAFRNPSLCIVFYFFSFVCDELDGRFARMFNQTSTFGAVLDMVTDRLATTGLLVILSMRYPAFHTLFITLVMLDIFSHWFQMYSTLLVGAATHKDIKSRSWLVRTYYRQRLFMGYCCVSCEVLYLSFYAASWPELMSYTVPGLRLPIPAQILQVLPGLATFAGSGDLPIFTLFGLLSLPGVFTKQICNWVQLTNAADTLVNYDLQKSQKAQ